MIAEEIVADLEAAALGIRRGGGEPVSARL
jgi:hypothetical protein